VFLLRDVLERMKSPPSLLRLAKQSGLSYTTVHGVYSNRAKRVDLATLDSLASALGVPVGSLIGPTRPAKRGRPA
jgi:transcriptional regulator with XRE-family HTH domain